MKYIYLCLIALIANSLFWGCNSDNNELSYKTAEEMRQKAIELKTSQPLKNPGKIYIKDDMLLINEMGKGIHLVFNENPAKPKKVGFVKIPGNIDVAMKGDIIYADNYMDLVTLNTKTGEIKRVKGAFKTFEKERREHLLAINNGAEPIGIRGTQFQAVSNGKPTSGGNPTGVGGSMARFTIVGNTLYVLDGNKMIVFDITEPSTPSKIKEIPLEFTVETIFPHEDHLFIGGTEGMYIYDNTNPQNPLFLSKFEHAVACDPVVVAGDFAYITLRSGGPCDRAINQLDVVNISNLNNPTLVSNYQMHNPHGLSVKENTLFLCDGNQGLKVFDVTDKNKILDNLQYADRDIRKAYDVIPNSENNTLIVVGLEGIFQYDAIDPEKLVRISEITIDV
ncbi:MAG: hypothetical protein MK207_09895 [Saprospiraceae bacterium]|nr:hypothetical protein [Saprospiraceae bacterium]